MYELANTLSKIILDLGGGAVAVLMRSKAKGIIMDGIVDQFTKCIDLVLSDGSRQSVDFNMEEKVQEGTSLYTVTLNRHDSIIVATSEQGFFDALRNVRVELERDDILLHCFGASENVYPSGMQASMGSVLLAYKMNLGKPSLHKDVVNIFDSDDSIKPATVSQQELFRERWIRSF